MQRKALAIDEKIGHLDGMAGTYGNLGLIYAKRGDLDQAEAMHRKSLAIEEKLGRLEGMASEYANLATIALQRGDIPGARESWTKARDLYTRIGMPHMVKEVQGLLDDPSGRENKASHTN
jgi:tetratricopeptide (TPR) repeat protein